MQVLLKMIKNKLIVDSCFLKIINIMFQIENKLQLMNIRQILIIAL